MKGFDKSPGTESGYELHAAEYKILFESTLDALVVFDPGLKRFIMCNPASCKLFGFSDSEEFMQMSPSDLSAEKQPDGRVSSAAVEEIVKRVLIEKHIEGRWLYKRKGGEDFLSNVKLSLIYLSTIVRLNS